MGLIFTDHDIEPIYWDDNADYEPNDNPTPEDYVFGLDDYVSNNFPARVNDGSNTYENSNFVNTKYYTPLEEEE